MIISVTCWQLVCSWHFHLFCPYYLYILMASPGTDLDSLTLSLCQCRKSGSALYTHYKVYKRSRCGRCSGTITVCRLGDNARMTYFCDRCQGRDTGGIHIRWEHNRVPNEVTGKCVVWWRTMFFFFSRTWFCLPELLFSGILPSFLIEPPFKDTP